MLTIRVYLGLYATCLGRAFRGLRHNTWTLLLPIALWAVLLGAGRLAVGLGIVGGILIGLLLDALFSSYLYFTGQIVAESRARLRELKASFLAYFWSVMGVAFVVWIAELLLGMALAQNPNAWLILLLARGVAFVLCNAAPEVIYQKGTYGGMATLQQSIRFIHENWIEWFIPNLVLSAAYFYLVSGLLTLGAPFWGVALLAGALLHLLMVFRGHLFRELDTSSHRQRMFKLGRAN
jgi:hypothetical protein